MDKKLNLALEAIDYLEEMGHGAMMKTMKGLAGSRSLSASVHPGWAEEALGAFNKNKNQYAERLINARNQRKMGIKTPTQLKDIRQSRGDMKQDVRNFK